MEIIRIPNGMFDSNCYIVHDNETGVIIDAGVKAKNIIEKIKNIKIEYIILTHSHIDHIAYIEELKSVTGAKTAAHELDGSVLSDVRANGSVLFGFKKHFNNADILLKEGQEISAGALVFNIIHTPGHTKGGMCIQTKNKNGKNVLFSGDTLFYESIGRSDFPRGDHSILIKSVKKLLSLPDDTIVYPGHGPKTTIGHEKKYNPFI